MWIYLFVVGNDNAAIGEFGHYRSLYLVKRHLTAIDARLRRYDKNKYDDRD